MIPDTTKMDQLDDHRLLNLVDKPTTFINIPRSSCKMLVWLTMVHFKGTRHVYFVNHETDMLKLFMGSEIIPPINLGKLNQPTTSGKGHFKTGTETARFCGLAWWVQSHVFFVDKNTWAMATTTLADTHHQIRIGENDGILIMAYYNLHMGVSLNGGTPKTPQNDHL